MKYYAFALVILMSFLIYAKVNALADSINQQKELPKDPKKPIEASDTAKRPRGAGNETVPTFFNRTNTRVERSANQSVSEVPKSPAANKTEHRHRRDTIDGDDNGQVYHSVPPMVVNKTVDRVERGVDPIGKIPEANRTFRGVDDLRLSDDGHHHLSSNKTITV